MIPKPQKYTLELKEGFIKELNKEREKRENKAWFAMRVTFRRELNIKRVLDEKSIENFIPMRYGIHITKNKKRKRILVPVIHNLIFVHTFPKTIKEIKNGIPYLQYMTTWKDGKRIPIIIPDEQMNQFIAVACTNDEHLLYVEAKDINLTQGTKVRIHGGLFDGLEGTYLRVKGSRQKRVVVAIEGVIAVAIATLYPAQIEEINQRINES